MDSVEPGGAPTAMTTLQPETEAGLGLRGALRKPRTMPDTEVDWSKWIVEIERQAKAALVGRLISAFEHEQCAGSHRGYCTGVLVSHDRIEAIIRSLISGTNEPTDG